MAAPLRRVFPSLGRALLSPTPARMLSAEASDALVEIKPGEIGMVSGIPEEHLRRKVLIYSPARTASQQGSGKVGRWKINFVSTQKYVSCCTLLVILFFLTGHTSQKPVMLSEGLPQNKTKLK
ncbi:hypothetical protein ACQJBY_015064 [Aegilops geniculata]|uniref:Uncharacterized protein n=1 Tax=Triticum turgidum subsp. durum TaxID=4567 RepID=A0A9R1RK66_TRITD|nr:unnamed protein product [Triticum turgidum subsp. durum]